MEKIAFDVIVSKKDVCLWSTVLLAKTYKKVIFQRKF